MLRPIRRFLPDSRSQNINVPALNRPMPWEMARAVSITRWPLVAAIRSGVFPLLASGASVLLPFGVALTLFALAMVGGTIWQRRLSTLEEAQRDIANLAQVLGEQTARSVDAIDVIIRDLQDDIVDKNIETPEAFAQILGAEETHRIFQARLTRLSQADAIVVADARGKLVHRFHETDHLLAMRETGASWGKTVSALTPSL
jgi:hypothetical protein